MQHYVACEGPNCHICKIIGPPDASINEDVMCGACCYDPPANCKLNCECPCHV